MSEENFTQIRVPTPFRDRIKERAARNFRTIPGELDFILTTVENMEALGIAKVEVLPGPKGSQKVPVVTMVSE